MASPTPRRLWPALLVAAASVCSAQQNQLQPSPLDNVPNWQKASHMTLQISAPGGGVSLMYDVVPFTMHAGLDRSDNERGTIQIRGPIVVATEATYNDITNPSVAYLSCDLRNESTTSEMMLTKLMENRPVAILMYSLKGNCCGLNGLNDSMPYKSIFTMTDQNEASETLNMTNSGNGWVQATIVGNTTSDSDGIPAGGGNNSAVAMSILYSITGLITLLFLIIIGTGAVRAHRYPERYGPRSGYGGRPRQSRAKGIARAVLDTLPIVKFGTPQQPEKPDPALEMDETEQQRKTRKGDADSVQAHHLSTIPEDAEAVPSGNNAPTRESRMPPDPATNPQPTIVESTPEPIGDEHLGCSICTEDFVVGEDVRVLPCDHKFHPPCIDPWLINVSGTCPLCRLDLQPRADDTDADDTAAQLSPPLGPDTEHDGTTGGASNSSRQGRRTSRFFDLNRLRHASVEERIEVLRRYRHESRVSGAGEANEEEERSRTSRLTHRLREKFRVRTRTHPPRHQEERESQGASVAP